jgi:hypothetical protein
MIPFDPYSPECVEGVSVLKNSSMPPWSLDQGLKDSFSAVFWPCFGGVGFVFDLPTGQIATFSTGCPTLQHHLCGTTCSGRVLRSQNEMKLPKERGERHQKRDR